MQSLEILVVIPIVILVFSGGNTQFLDPQYYKLRKLENDTSGLYVLDGESWIERQGE